MFWGSNRFRVLVCCPILALVSACSSERAKVIELPGDRAYPESIAAAKDGTLYISGLASGGVWRIKPNTTNVEPWIVPGAFDSRSTFGVLVDDKKGLLWVCSNDMSGRGVPGPGAATGSNLKGFDLASGAGKVSVPLPGSDNLCNDMAVGSDGSVFVTNSLKPQILRLRPNASTFEVFVESPTFEQPKEGAGLDGIAFGADGNLYVNNFTSAGVYRVDVENGAAGAVTKLSISRSLKLPDGLRPVGDGTFVMAEGGGTVDRATVKGDDVKIETLKDRLAGPTGVALVGDALWATEGQLPHLFDAKTGPPSLPFRVIGVRFPK